MCLARSFNAYIELFCLLLYALCWRQCCGADPHKFILIRIQLFTLMRIEYGSYLSLWCGSGSYLSIWSGSGSGSYHSFFYFFSRFGLSNAPIDPLRLPPFHFLCGSESWFSLSCGCGSGFGFPLWCVSVSGSRFPEWCGSMRIRRGGGAITWYALRMAGVQALCLLVKWSSISCLRLEVNWHSPHFIVFTSSCTVRQCSRIASKG